MAPLPVMDLKPPHLVIALRNANIDHVKIAAHLPSPIIGLLELQQLCEELDPFLILLWAVDDGDPPGVLESWPSELGHQGEMPLDDLRCGPEVLVPVRGA